MPGHSGRLTAAPILFKIADLLGSGAAPTRVATARGSASGCTATISRRACSGSIPARRRGRRAPAGGPKILYPPDGALIEWHGEELPLEAAGGRRPLRWLVDGKPLPPAAPRRPLYWQPDGVGFARLTVIDGDGRSAHGTVRL